MKVRRLGKQGKAKWKVTHAREGKKKIIAKGKSRIKMKGKKDK